MGERDWSGVAWVVRRKLTETDQRLGKDAEEHLGMRHGNSFVPPIWTVRGGFHEPLIEATSRRQKLQLSLLGMMGVVNTSSGFSVSLCNASIHLR